MSSKYVDNTSIIQVIGCVFNKPSLLELSDKYMITDEDFSDSLHKTLFGIIYKLYQLGNNIITLQSVEDFLESRPKSLVLYNQRKGAEWLTKASHAANLEAFDYYYNRLKKMSLLRAYDSFGIDVSEIYDVDNILEPKKRQEQEDYLDNSSLEQIAARIDDKVSAIRAKYLSNVSGAVEQAGAGINDLIEDLKKNPEVGIPMYGSYMNTVTRGARLRKFYLRSAPSGYGKAIPNYTMIPTPNGYKSVGEIKVGDYLFGQDGKPTKVLAIHPQPEEKEIWKVTFSDGRVAECCGEHLWEYRYETHRGYAYRVEDIQTIYNRTLSLKNGLRNSEDRGYRFHVKLNEAVNYTTKQYSIHPYVMGALLGDGSFRYDNTNKAITFSADSDETPNRIASLLGKDVIAVKCSDFNYNYCFKNTKNLKHNLWVEELLRDYPELWNVKSENKFIPKEYLMGDKSQRMELLRGLMDTDGTIDPKGRTSFTTTSERLKDDFIELVHGLGMITGVYEDVRPEQYTTGKCYMIHVQCKKSLKPDLFTLNRKVEKATNYAMTHKREEFKDHLAIIDIEKTNKKTAMTCFTVDNESHLFLMNDYIVTHNTRMMVADACYFSCSEIYYDSIGWVRLTPQQPTLFIATEQDLSEIQTLMLAFIAEVDEQHILDGEYEEGEEERILKAAEIIKKAPLYIKELSDFSLSDVENVIKENIREHDIMYVCYDYIHTSMKILEEITKRSGGVKLREDNILFMLSNKLKDICNQYGIFILSATQLSGDWKDSDTPDQNLLRGAKSIADKIDFGSILLGVNQKDIESLETILASNGFDKPVLKISIYKNRRGQYKGIYMWCKANLGCCRVDPIFCTTWNYEPIEMNDIKINVTPKGAF